MSRFSPACSKGSKASSSARGRARRAIILHRAARPPHPGLCAFRVPRAETRMSTPSDVHYKLMRLLDANPGMSQRDAARALGISLGKVNYCLQALMQKGWIKATISRTARTSPPTSTSSRRVGCRGRRSLTLRVPQDKDERVRSVCASRSSRCARRRNSRTAWRALTRARLGWRRACAQMQKLSPLQAMAVPHIGRDR